MKGDLVIVRTYGGVPLVRRVWEEDDRGVYITDDTRLQRLLDGDTEVMAIGFPREDVFEFGSEKAIHLDSLWKSGKWDWNQLTPY